MLHQLMPHTRLTKIVSSVAVVTSVGFTVAAQQPVSAFSLTPVDTELSLLVDVSLSVDSGEYNLQMGAYQNAFTSLAPLFGTEQFGSVAVNLIQWAARDEQQESISWTLIDDEASALQFAEAIGALDRFPENSGTAPGSAIEFAVPLFSSNDYEGERWVIDVSGDGVRNSGVWTSDARDNALAAGVSAINGLPILPLTFSSSLDDWYANNIQGGEGSFTIPAYGFEDIERALEEKLVLELTLPPVDSPIEPPVDSPIDSPVEPPVDSPVTAVPGPTNILGIAAMSVLARLKRRRSVEHA